MTNVISLAAQKQKPASSERYEEIETYGRVGPLTVALVRAASDPAGPMHVVLRGAAIRTQLLTTLPGNDWNRKVADIVGSAVLHAVELAEIEFNAAALAPPEAS